MSAGCDTHPKHHPQAKVRIAGLTREGKLDIVPGVTLIEAQSPIAGMQARDSETRDQTRRHRDHLPTPDSVPTPDPASGSHLVGMTPAEKRRYCDRARARSHRKELHDGAVELLLRYPWEVSMTITFQPNTRRGRARQSRRVKRALERFRGQVDQITSQPNRRRAGARHSRQFCERHLERFLDQVEQHHWGREDGLFERSSLAFAIAWEKQKSGQLHAHVLGLGAPDGWWDYAWCRETAIADPAIGRSFDIQGLPTGTRRERAVLYVAKYITKDLRGLDFVHPERLRALSASPGAGAVAGSV